MGVIFVYTNIYFDNKDERFIAFRPDMPAEIIKEDLTWENLKKNNKKKNEKREFMNC